jgi:hypothetical protein
MRPLEVPAVATLVGAALLLVLFPRTDRGEAVRRARQLTARYGVPAASQEIPAEAIVAGAIGGIA